ncbi:hypothetical protein D8674_042121 [Pyrus ussuriensis x Pyrus communis]|uniref:No apical meristem-associated C-terminal domain-containing protein n=1 Tax=Pyrus ussuriensis x Pyrus communis TaxID=2448454 RepID=A0A5N5FH43_9ROSA|nr:hypothetical protein D8674_042121 [Pyrus ussuriensis x Pyrus communis]
MKGRVWTRNEDEALCRTYRWVSEDSVRQAEELYMKDGSKPFQFHSCWEICKGWVLFEDPPQHRVGPMSVFGTQSSTVDGDEMDLLPFNKQGLMEKDKANDDYAAQQEVTASLRLMAKQNVFAAEERNRGHEERAKQIQEEMDDRNMQGNTSDYSPMSKAYFDKKKKKKKKREIMARRQLFTSDYTPTMANDEDDVDYGL